MWIVKIALSRPYTFIVLALLILISEPGCNSADTDRHLSQYQYSCGCRRLDLYRPKP